MLFNSKNFFFIFVLALVVRISYIALVPPRPLNLDDSFQWNNTALHFLHGNGFLTQTENLDPKRPPFYPLFLTANYALFGEENFKAVKISQAIFGSLTCVGIYEAASLLISPPAALGAGILAALYPPLIVYCEILQSETLFTFLLIFFVLFWILAIQRTRWIYFLSAGFFLGLLNLCRGTLVFFPFFMLAIPIFFEQERKKWRRYLALIAVSFFVLSPWTWRNFKVYDAFIPSAGGGPESFWAGTLPIDRQQHYGDFPEFKNLNFPPTVKGVESLFTAEAVSNIKKNPKAYGIITFQKLCFFIAKPIGQELVSKRSHFWAQALTAFHFMILILLVKGVVLLRLKKIEFSILYCVIIYFALLHILTNPMPRYRLPIEALFLIFASAALFSKKNQN